MPKYPETRALLEQALRHLLLEQETLLRRVDSRELIKPLKLLNQLAINTNAVLTEGFHQLTSTSGLTRQAQKIESAVDALSVKLWTHIPVSISAIYERIERSLKREPGKTGFVADTRAHYHNLRLRLLEQLLGARMLVLNSDLGDELERIWQQFLERHLGPNFKVLRGGHIYDHHGNRSDAQIDLIVTSVEAHVFVPGDSDGGNAYVLNDQIISAIMITSNLTAEKLKEDWRKLQSLPTFPDLEKDHPHLKGHPWPLCYILASQSDPVEELVKAWQDLCDEGATQVVPQLIIALDTGFFYSGVRRWPCPRFPGNYTEAKDVHAESGIYSGLGLAWLIAQHQGRLAAIKRQALGTITRFADLLNDSMMRPEGVPPTHSHRRFNTSFLPNEIAGVMQWGSCQSFAHNRLMLSSLKRTNSGTDRIYQELFLPDVDPQQLRFANLHEGLRWVNYDVKHTVGLLVAVEEWLHHRSKKDHSKRIAVFNTATGEEVVGSVIEALQDVEQLETVKSL